MTAPTIININAHLYDLNDHPLVMGILNHTPDSFYSGSRIEGERAIHQRIEEIISEGGDLIDVGGYSTRPDADEVTPDEEWRRVREVLIIIRKDYPNIPVSVDTFRADVAKRAVLEGGAHLINDVSGGRLDPLMFTTVGELGVPYILMHMRGTPQTMQSLTEYDGRVADVVIAELLDAIVKLRAAGVKDIILDPGFGFSKTLEQNYELMADLKKFILTGYPLLVGVSRKSMIYRLLGSTPEEALNGTTVLHTMALMAGAHILRVHDVRAAVETVTMVKALKNSKRAE